MRTQDTILKQALEPLTEQLQEIDQHLCAIPGPEPIGGICFEMFKSGGKRLRATAAVAVARAFNLPNATVIKLGELVEIVHAATLLQDDVIDEADIRRGQLAARRRWSNMLSILGGDYLLVRSLELVAQLREPRLLDFFIQTLDRLLSAEVAQHMASRNQELSIEGYLEIARGKTGSLFGLACASPPQVASSESEFLSLRDFGENFGIAFQIADDIRDIIGLDSTKPMGLDLLDGIYSLPLRLAAQDSSSCKEMLLNTRLQTPDPDLLKELSQQILQTSALIKAIEIGEKYCKKAYQALHKSSYVDRMEALSALQTWIQSEFHSFRA